MDQIYFLEIMIDTLCVFVRDDDPPSSSQKNLIIDMKFGPKYINTVKEILPSDRAYEDKIECDDDGTRKWCRVIRIGKSFLFPSCPEKLQETLIKCPIEVEVYTDDQNEQKDFVGVGTMPWDKEFYTFIRETEDPRKLHLPLAVKQVNTMFLECCCARAGEVTFFLRLSALGQSITTEFQQLTNANPLDSSTFRTNRAPTMFESKRVVGDDVNFCMIGTIYETVTLEDPDFGARKKIEVCTELEPCNAYRSEDACRRAPDRDPSDPIPKEYKIEKIRMGDIVGPCGNSNCALALKIKDYIRTLDGYKKATEGKKLETKPEVPEKLCGTCSCKDDRYHRASCPEVSNTKTCTGCGGVVPKPPCEDKTCPEKVPAKEEKGSAGVSPKSSKGSAPAPAKEEKGSAGVSPKSSKGSAPAKEEKGSAGVSPKSSKSK